MRRSNSVDVKLFCIQPIRGELYSKCLFGEVYHGWKFSFMAMFERSGQTKFRPYI